MEEDRVSTTAWLARIAGGVFIGNVLFSLAAWAAMMLWLPDSRSLVSVPNVDEQAAQSSADNAAADMEREADRMEAMADGTTLKGP